MAIAVAYLRELTPFNHIFTDGIVPVISSEPSSEAKHLDPCYIIDGESLTTLQTELLAAGLIEKCPIATTYETAYLAIRLGISASCYWFHAASDVPAN